MPAATGGITPQQFVEKWSKTELSERAASHEHFIDLCQLLGQPTPAEADATGEDYCFEKHVKVVGSASKGSKGDAGFVDVWKRGHFAWEYKRKDKHKTLDEAYRQLYQYRDDLDNPPLSVVCDIRTTEIRAHFAGYPTEKTVVKLEEIPGRLETLRRIFTNPESFKPAKTREQETTDLAEVFGDLADKLLDRIKPAPATLWHGAGDPVAHFLMKVMFCLFAEDVDLLPDKLFTKLVNRCLFEPERFKPLCTDLFERMKEGGWYGNDRVEYFNGGLFDDAPPLALNSAELPVLGKAATRPWQAVEPSIFGTLFERILDPKKRAQIGAHYTSKADILLVVEPVVMTPLRRKWKAVQEEIASHLEQVIAERDRKKRDVIAAPVRVALDNLRRHLGAQRILDPACGSGNFLYVALQQLLDLDDEIVRFAARHDIALNPLPYIRPTQLHGIEINSYAAELAQNVIWIGYLQWLAEHKIDNPKRPILDKLQTIENRDAILDLSNPNLPVPAQWPEADFIIGNPPFLGCRHFRESGLTIDYIRSLHRAYDLPKTLDLCCYWFEAARRVIEKHPTVRAGLLATQAIRGVSNRAVLQRIAETGGLFFAWSNKPWILEGAAVNVAIIGFDSGAEETRTLDGRPVQTLSVTLSSQFDVTQALSIAENEGLAFQGQVKVGAFDLPPEQARQLLAAPNPHDRTNADVVKPWVNASDLVQRPSGSFIIDFADMSVAEAAKYAAPFRHVEEHVKAVRATNADRQRRENWWRLGRSGSDLRSAKAGLHRVLATPRVSKYRLFVWVRADIVPDARVVCVASESDAIFGILQSNVHGCWSVFHGARHGDGAEGGRLTYSNQHCFENFAFPMPPRVHTHDPLYQRIAPAAKVLNEQRERWLNPPEWIGPIAARIDAEDKFEDVPPEARALVRQSAIMAAAAKDLRLKKRTLTNLYNERPTWLRLAHERLDRAVLAAYAAVDPDGIWDEDWADGWTESGAGQSLAGDHPLASRRAEVEQAVLANLLRLNHARAESAGRSRR